MPELYSKPTDVSAKDGKVVLDGPDGVDVALTPEAAEETSNRLLEGAAEAAGQQRAVEQDKRERAARRGNN